jgi:hypothetical protein
LQGYNFKIETPIERIIVSPLPKRAPSTVHRTVGLLNRVMHSSPQEYTSQGPYPLRKIVNGKFHLLHRF